MAKLGGQKDLQISKMWGKKDLQISKMWGQKDLLDIFGNRGNQDLRARDASLVQKALMVLETCLGREECHSIQI